MVAIPRVGRERPSSGNFELYSWYFFRISGLLLILLAVVHVIIMHVINSVSEIDYRFVANRWGSPFWRFFDWMLLTLALLHGLNGARIAIDDYIQSRGWRIVALSALWTATIAFLILGSVAIVTFNPAAFNTVATGR